MQNTDNSIGIGFYCSHTGTMVRPDLTTCYAIGPFLPKNQRMIAALILKTPNTPKLIKGENHAGKDRKHVQ